MKRLLTLALCGVMAGCAAHRGHKFSYKGNDAQASKTATSALTSAQKSHDELIQCIHQYVAANYAAAAPGDLADGARAECAEPRSWYLTFMSSAHNSERLVGARTGSDLNRAQFYASQDQEQTVTGIDQEIRAEAIRDAIALKSKKP